MNIIYSPKYEVDVGEHVFIMAKYRLTKERLLADGAFAETDFLEPEPATDDDILLVHNPDYALKLKNGTLSLEDQYALEIKYSPELVEASWLWAGGSIAAGRLALETGACYHLGGGFHHAFPDHGEGFCAVNDHSIAIRRLLRDGVIHKAMVIDCDVHQANGTATIFAADEAVFTFSIHEQSIYPAMKPPSDLDVGLPDGAGDDLYLDELGKGIDTALGSLSPDLIFYVAGGDTYSGDQLGGLNLSIGGMKKRDELVCAKAKTKGVPVAAVLAGGYAADLNDLVTIHANTAIVMKEMLG